MGRGQAKISAFLKALAVDAPAAASTPQRQAYVSPRAVQPRERERQFSYIFGVTFVLEPTDDLIAEIELRIKPRDSSFGAARASEVWAQDNHHLGPGVRQATRTMLTRTAETWPPAARLLADVSTGTVAVTADELALLGDGRTVSHLLAAHIDVRWPPDLVRTLETKAVVGRMEAPGSERTKAFAADQLFELQLADRPGRQDADPG